MYISTTLTTKQTFQATNPKQSNPQSSLSNYFNHSDTVHSFNVKPIKILSDPVAEAFGLIHRHPSGENFRYGIENQIRHKLSEQVLHLKVNQSMNMVSKCFMG